MKLNEFMNPEWILLDLIVDDKYNAIKSIFNQIDSCEVIGEERKQIFEEIIEREKLMSTGIGNGLAIPHAKSEICPDFFFNVGILQTGIDFNSIDHIPVKIVCLLVGPSEQPNKHIKLLSRLSKLLNQKSFRDELYQSKSGQEIYDIFVKYEDNL